MGEGERTGRRAAVAIGLWVVVVVSGSWLVWTVIAAAGGSFVGGGTPMPVSQASTSPKPAPTRSATHAPSTPEPTTRTTPVTPTAPTSAADQAPTTPSSVVRSRTWSGAPGVVTVRCIGARVELGGAAVTASGYAVEVNRRGPQVVEVEFHQRPDGRDTRVVARCRDGSPVFAATTDD